MSDEEITAGEAARIAGVSRQRINQLAEAGRLGRQVAGRYWVFTRAEIEAYTAQPKRKGGRPKARRDGRTAPAGVVDPTPGTSLPNQGPAGDGAPRGHGL